MTLGERIQALRKEAGFSQEELGEKLGVARQSVSKWESDATIPELDKLIAMSRLFHISVGALLGLEESEGADHELTDRELKALEEIARKLTPEREAAPPETSGRKRRWLRAAAALAVIVAGLTLMSRINSLENQLGNLQYNVSNIQNTVSREIGSISSQVRDILEEQNSVTAGKNYEVADMDLLNGTVTFALTATPREYREGMRAVFSATGPDFEAVEAEGTLGAGQTFAAELTCPLTDDITLSVGFVEGDSTVTQQLGQERYRRSGTEISFDGNLAWSISGRTVRELTANAYVTDLGYYKTAAEGWQTCSLVEGAVRLWRNDELIWSHEWESDSHSMWTGTVEAKIPTEGLEAVERGERFILSLRYTDNAGREDEVFLDGFEMGEDGPGGMAKPIQMAPYDEDWENNYPWQ